MASFQSFTMQHELYLHPLLGYSQHNITPGHCCPILWDLHEPPEAARRVLQLDKPLAPSELNQLATSPPVVELTITCDLFPGDWPIVVRRLQGVTVLDAFEAVHTALMRQIRQEEWEQLCPKQQARVEIVFNNRCKLSLDRDACRSRGVLRIDCLLYHVWFGGLSISPGLENTLILTLRRPQ
ncbi:unnamed protein product [Cyclocybe aegerita]|uniref:DUF6699 domain-containing protein n=1 Tax=Cyclocybe aegerita TaxID=1973307 RepID=A0A8S0W294_CYCAE|nr:unnamed protein product [Cyclocybe aegerita]